MRQEGRIRRHHDDDRPGALVIAAWRRRRVAQWTLPRLRRIAAGNAGLEVRDLLAHGNAGYPEVAAGAVVALHEHADRVAALLRGKPARRGADATLEPVAHHSRPATDVALGHRSALGPIERADDVLGPNVEPVDVVQAPVVRLSHDRQPPRLHPRLADLPLQNRIAHDADAVRVRDRDRSLEDPRLLQPGGPRHLAIAVEREPGAEDR